MLKIAQLIGSVLALVVFSSVASADLLTLDSHAGLPTSNGPTTVAITPDPLWQANNPVNPGDPTDNSAVWISFADTGYGGSQFQPFEGTTPVVSVFQSFVSDPGLLTLNVWADDTADVLLDGNYLAHAAFTQSICSGQPIGCRPQDDGVFNVPIAAGPHLLQFVLYQVGTGSDTSANPFGLLYTGTVPKDPPPADSLNPVPEPASASLLLMGTILLCTIQKCRRSS
jgi:hypothetical protein